MHRGTICNATLAPCQAAALLLRSLCLNVLPIWVISEPQLPACSKHLRWILPLSDSPSPRSVFSIPEPHSGPVACGCSERTRWFSHTLTGTPTHSPTGSLTPPIGRTPLLLGCATPNASETQDGGGTEQAGRCLSPPEARAGRVGPPGEGRNSKDPKESSGAHPSSRSPTCSSALGLLLQSGPLHGGLASLGRLVMSAFNEV